MPRTFLATAEEDDILNTTRMKTWVHGYCPSWPKDKQVPFPAPNPTKSYWIEEFKDRLDDFCSTTQLPLESDVVIIGSGMTGVSAAYHLVHSNPELKILMLDTRGFCCGATGRNGGHMFRPEGYGMRGDVEALGVERAVEVRKFHIANRDAMRKIVLENGIESQVDMTFKGGVQIFGSAEERDEILADLKYCEEIGFEHGSEVLDAQEMNEKLQCHNRYGGIFTPRSGSFWPRKYCVAIMNLALSTSKGNLNLQTNTCVTALAAVSSNQMRWELTTRRGKVRAKSVLHATNGHLMSLLPELAETSQQVSPVKDMIASFHPEPTPSSRGTWPLNVLVSNAMHYMVQLPAPSLSCINESDVIYGLYYEFNSPDDSTLLEDPVGAVSDQRAVLPLLFPEKFSKVDNEGKLPREDVKYVWTGICGHTTDWSVMLGPVKSKKGQFMSAGYNGAGMAKCWLSGRCVAEMILWELKSRDRTEKWKIPDWYPEHFCKNLEEL